MALAKPCMKKIAAIRHWAIELFMLATVVSLRE
jgi:hypothetical protein